MNFYVSSYSNVIYVFNIDDEGRIHLLNSYKVKGTPSYIRRHKNILFAALKNVRGNSGGFVSYDIYNGSLKIRNYYKSQNSFTHLYVNDDFILGGSYHQGCIEVHNRHKNDIIIRKYPGSKIHNVGKLNECCYYAVNLSGKRIYVYKIARDKIIDLFEVKLKYSPRHILNSENGGLIYILNEDVSILSVYNLNHTDAYLLQEISVCPEFYKGKNEPSAIRSDRSGNYIFVSNRGHNSISVFKRNILDGRLELVNNISSGGETPRDFNIINDAGVIVVLNQDSNNIISFRLSDGMNKSELLSEFIVPRPVCMEV